MEDETVGWHHQFNGHKLGQTLRDEGFIMKLKDACPWKKNYDKPRQCIKKQRQHFANQGPYSQDYYGSTHILM